MKLLARITKKGTSNTYCVHFLPVLVGVPKALLIQHTTRVTAFLIMFSFEDKSALFLKLMLSKAY